MILIRMLMLNCFYALVCFERIVNTPLRIIAMLYFSLINQIYSRYKKVWRIPKTIMMTHEKVFIAQN